MSRIPREKIRELAIQLHKKYSGKIEIINKVPLRTADDLSLAYTPGVADACMEIVAHKELAYDYTSKANLIAVVTDGSRVLGLGNIGPAGLPVMEGKSLLFKMFGGVDAFPICLGTQDQDQIVQAVEWLAPSFGGINLEDIDAPKCFYVHEKLMAKLDIPVFHDDQQGTAVVIAAGLINALKVVGKKIGQTQVSMIGAGAAGLATCKLLMEMGVKGKNIFLVDSKGVLYDGRGGMDPWKERLAKVTNREKRTGGIMEAMKGTDAVIALSKPGPGVITKEMVQAMASNSIVFALANPVPEIWPEDAKAAGAKVVATGRSDFPNQVNNQLGFPAIFRGVLDVRAKTINVEMQIAAARAIAKVAERKGLSEGYIIPLATDVSVVPREAAAVAKAAMDTGVARIKVDPKEIAKKAAKWLKMSRRKHEKLWRAGLTLPP